MSNDSGLKTTVVMVDDDADDVLMLRRAANVAGLDVAILHLAAGHEFLDAFTHAALPERCLVLLDLNMPAMDGFEVLERLRRMPRGELVPVVVFTTSSDQVHVERAFASGANAFLIKPSTLKETTELMSALVTFWLVHGQVPTGMILPRQQVEADSRPPQRLLVLASQPDLGNEVALLLRDMPRGWEIEVITRPDEVSTRLRQGRYDAWLVDQSLMAQVGEQVNLLPTEIRPPMVVVASVGQEKNLDTWQALGAVDCLTREELRPALLDRTLRFAASQWRSQRLLERSQQDLLRSERMATIGRMAAGVAHEYNNLNAVVLAGLERLHKHIDADPSAHQLIGRILGALERSRRIGESLMTLGRPQESVMTVVNLRPQVADTLVLLELRARRLGATLRMEGPDTPCMVRIDTTDLHQVLSNLVVNALHAVHRATDPTVTVRLEASDGWVTLKVSDNGVGIPPEDMSRLFQPFFTRKGAQDRNELFPVTIEGTGLGLSVCQVLVERVGGELNISSRVGLGTTVTVKLPMAIGAAAKSAHVSLPAASPSAASPPAVSPPAASAAVISNAAPPVGEEPLNQPAPSRARVAVLDDNAILCQLLHETLSESGFIVHSHIDPRRFLAEEDLSQIDFLVLDWQMPGLSGGEVLKRLGDANRKSPLRVLVVSGEVPVIPQTLPPGVTVLGLLPKPYRLGDLVARLNAK